MRNQNRGASLCLVARGVLYVRAYSSVRADMSRSRRSAGDGSLPSTLFGLDDDEVLQRKKRKKAQQEQPTVESAVEKVAADKVVKVAEQGTTLPDPDAVAKVAAVTKKTVKNKATLTKAQWKQVTQVKMVDHWGDDPEVVSYKFVPPTAADPYYFWVHWDTAKGREGLDKCGWQVGDLNRYLAQGKLEFRCVEDKAFTTSFAYGEGVTVSKVETFETEGRCVQPHAPALPLSPSACLSAHPHSTDHTIRSHSSVVHQTSFTQPRRSRERGHHPRGVLERRSREGLSGYV